MLSFGKVGLKARRAATAPLRIEHFACLDGQTLLVAGWSIFGPLQGLELRWRGFAAQSDWLTWHQRPELPNPRAAGFLAAFPLADARRLSGRAVQITGGARVRRIKVPDPLDDGARLMGEASDAVLLDLLRALVEDRHPALPPQILGHLWSRLSRADDVVREEPWSAFSLDQTWANGPSGFGVVEGWYLGDDGGRDLQLAALGARGVARVEIFPQTLVRPDLMAYEGRYPVSGSDGFFGLFRLGAESGTDITLIAMTRGDEPLSAVRRRAAPVGRRLMSRALSKYRRRTGGEATARFDGVLGAVGLPAATGPLRAPSPPAPGVLLLLDHDSRDGDLRTVLDIARDTLGPDLSLQLLRATDSAEMRQALAGVERDLGEPGWHPRPISPDPGLAELGQGPGMVCFARSTALVQFKGLAALAARVASGAIGAGAILHDPLLAVGRPADAGQMITSLVRDSAPFAAVLDTAVLVAAAGAQPDCFASTEGRIRAILWSLAASNQLHIELDRAPAFFGARTHAPDTDPVLEGADLHWLDAALLASTHAQQRALA